MIVLMLCSQTSAVITLPAAAPPSPAHLNRLTICKVTEARRGIGRIEQPSELTKHNGNWKVRSYAGACLPCCQDALVHTTVSDRY